ncbi:transposase [candidate division KSB1 bacterium]|nr:transposase [candidate division KSB1 bacterium]
MSHSLTKLWVHAIWGTKDRIPLLKDPFRSKIIHHIQDKLEELDCGVRIINGTADHFHALFLLCNDKSLAEVMKMIKGESSHWINQQDIISRKFAWQVGYGGFSVSESMVKQVEDYIRKQEEHHRKMTFQEEYDRFLKQYGLSEKPMNRLNEFF